MIGTIIDYILAVGLTILVIVVSAVGFYLVLILRDLSSITSRINELTELSESYFVKPIIKFVGVLKQYKSLKKFVEFISHKNEKER